MHGLLNRWLVYLEFGISISFFDVKIGRKVTIFLRAEPLIAGKRASDLSKAIKKSMLLSDLKPEYFVQAIADEEGAVQNCLKSLFPKSNVSVCLAHKLATLIKHAFACSPKPNKGLEFFISPMLSKFFSSFISCYKFFFVISVLNLKIMCRWNNLLQRFKESFNKFS